jgi:hypothetical protein
MDFRKTHMPSRRTFLSNTTGFCAYALVAELGIANAHPNDPSARRWLSLQSDLARELKTGALSQTEWHRGVNALARDIDLEHLAAELRRARIKDAGSPFGHDPQKRFVTVVDDEGQVVKLGYGLALFDFKKDSVITPHAHQYMASAHMVIEGRIRVRAFDRVRDESDALIIRPTADVVAEPGYSAAMTSPRDNVHWFVPRSVRAMTLDIIIDGLGPGADRYLIQPVDPLRGVQLSDGTIRAPLISFDRSMQLYSARD